MNYHQTRLLMVSALVLIDGRAIIQAQTSADSAALTTAIADVIINESAHREPFILTGPQGSTWAPSVAAALKLRHPEALATALSSIDEFHALHVSVSNIRVIGDTARADVTWSRCISGPGLNFWEHEMTYFFVRSGGAWRFSAPGQSLIADGTC